MAVRRCDVVTVTAAVGAGKSTTIAQALAEHPRVAWVRLDGADAAPARLLSYLGGALRRVVPDPSGRVMAAALAHTAVATNSSAPTEVAGLLAAHAARYGVVLVLDRIERLGDSAAAWEVVRGLVEYGAPGLTVVLVGRRPIPSGLFRIPLVARAETLPSEQFNLDLDEVRTVIDLVGAADRDAGEILAATGGWPSAVLDLVHGDEEHLDRLTEHVLTDLPPALVEFLEQTSALPEITVPTATALGLPDVPARFQDLTRTPVPGVLSGQGFRCYPVFRERLSARFEQRSGPEVRQIRTRLARSYLREGRTEDAVTTMLHAGATAEAGPIAEAVIVEVIERGDLELARTWLSSLPPELTDSDHFTTAQLMLAIGQDDFTRGLDILNRLEATGSRDALAARSDRAAAMMAWCYLHQGRPDALAEVLAAARSVPLAEAVRYASWMITNPGGHDPPVSPPLSGAPSDALILIADYTFGRRTSSDPDRMTEWVRIVSRADRISALRASGRLTEALREYDEALAGGSDNLALRVYIGPELFIDAQLADRARAAVDEGRTLAEGTGSVGYRALNAIAAAKYALRLADDPAAARRILDTTAHLIEGREFRLISGVLDTWYGLALLRQSVNLAAANRLRRAVRSMQEGHRLLELPIAAVYLAEAEWRLGDEAAADRAADLALNTARALEMNHQLLRALRDVPEVASRRIDAVPGSDSPWHALGRALLTPEPPAVAVATTPGTAIRLHDFGKPALDIDDRRVHPRITKSYELVGLLTSTPRHALSRAEVLTALFPHRPPRTAATYLRQAVHCLRQVLGDPATLRTSHAHIAFAPDAVVTSNAARFETLLTEAGRLQGLERLDVLAEALSLADTGPYLARTESPWVQQRRQHLADLADSARFEAAELSFDLGRFQGAGSHCDAILAADPYQEAAWRLRMRISNALGSDTGVLTAYRRCTEALAELGTEPANSTRTLLDRLRR
jgi:DNA-binding SARP family transcriptional activator